MKLLDTNATNLHKFLTLRDNSSNSCLILTAGFAALA